VSSFVHKGPARKVPAHVEAFHNLVAEMTHDFGMKDEAVA
jgi:hypothetical protein